MGGIKMKEFNLDEFKKNLSQKVVTRDGRSEYFRRIRLHVV